MKTTLFVWGMYMIMWVVLAWFFLEPVLGIFSALTHIEQILEDFIAIQV